MLYCHGARNSQFISVPLWQYLTASIEGNYSQTYKTTPIIKPNNILNRIQ